MSDWTDPIQRATVWHVAGFAALGSVLVAGAQLSGFDWSEARHPLAAVAAMVLAIAAAAVIVVLGTRVLTPPFTLFDLRVLESNAQRRLQAKLGGSGVSWERVAKESAVLNQLCLDGFADSPITLTTRVRQGDVAAEQDAARMVVAANEWFARQAFRGLRVATPVAFAVVLAGVLMWGSLSRIERRNPTAEEPVPVRVILNLAVSPAAIFGPGCNLRVLRGAAIAGDLKARPLVAVAPQEGCPAGLLTVEPSIGTVQRA